ncbi:MAG: hypothetical protein KZQ59_09145 [Candidatus Thiodiazotropha sp. (ex Lucinoma aequizonata)]|nr:hypothetical protein [Candidatus Thiodiazotropha sp. (ex Lucinoma aequizonata)]MCU7895345.1 hypothetical protein [Candidatus Thiodiazotropha sp. (ex Lucinoma aequizonata)]MCU7899433.1 hypothetical protein [Candidatus Thiodiazotropha sp. (ex Lucinoma aequizonata)]MCU7910875.1 hypothetical protein [Candidatus Thiodiazotropha sp. (ex Lucinoma aequizonata)]
MLNSHLIGFLALAKERVRLLPFGWHPGTQLLGAHLNSYTERKPARREKAIESRGDRKGITGSHLSR